MFLTNLAYGGGGKLLRPGDRVNVQTPVGTHGVTTLSPDVAQSLTNVGRNRVFGQFLKQFADVPANTKALAAARFQRGVACAYDLLQAHGQGDLPTQLPEYSRGLYGDLEEGLIALQFAT